MISIIVPIYNIQIDILYESLNSLRRQDSGDVEFLLVDDGSTYEVGGICDEFVRKDSRFKVFHRSNSGVSNSRNFGLIQSMGDYVIFVDGDDCLTPGIIRSIENFIKSNHEFDIAYFAVDYVPAASSKTIRRTLARQGAKLMPDISLPSNLDISKGILCSFDGVNDAIDIDKSYKINFSAPWGKVFRKNYLIQNKIEFPELIKRSEDRLFNIEALGCNPRTIYIPYCGYLYLYRENSLGNTFSEAQISMILESYSELLNIIRSRYSQKDSDYLIKDAPIFLLESFCAITKNLFGRNNLSKEFYGIFCDGFSRCKNVCQNISMCSISSKFSKFMLILLRYFNGAISYFLLSSFYFVRHFLNSKNLYLG